ncbi:uncharacterized protein BJX67DRAFT_360458 [Aspergillus lucknowensis]|uniref:Pentatricopeptide repeat protein n=1 Tax=Aspergillus lucknowensis TaxID=176173 RepID=A0ABR4LJE8_9EURO
MHRIYSRTVPVGPTSACVSCLTTAAEGVASRTASAASKRRLRIGNSVTALYTSIFAAAALVDARAKDKRRLEWQEKIAAVKEEVKELIDEEQRLLEALASRSAEHSLPRMLQTGPCRSISRPTNRSIQLPRTTPHCRWSHSMSKHTKPDAPGFHEKLERSIIAELRSENGTREDPDDFEMAIDGEEIPDWLHASLIRGKVIRKLALKQLAIRLILRPSVAHSYMGVLQNYDNDSNLPKIDTAFLLNELNEIRRRIRRVKTDPAHSIDDLARDISVRRLEDMVEETTRLDGQVRQDTQLYLSNQMSLEELLLRLSDLLLKATDPDRTYVFKMMILAFTKTRQNDLALLVIKTILPYKFPLSSSLIITILNFFRKSKDLKGFDLFLQMLRGKGYPVDLGTLGYYKEKVVNGIRITVPPVHSANIVTYATLIKACLRFDQPERADAYLSSARAAGCMDDFAILMAYLEFCTVRRDWERGIQVLRRTLAFIGSTTAHPLERVERLVVLMVHLSDSCEEFELSNVLIEAAVSSGFDQNIPQHQTDVVFEHDTNFNRWAEAAELAPTQQGRLSVGDMCFAFVKSVSGYLDALTIPEEQRTAHRLQKLMGVYAKQALSSVVSAMPAQTKGDGRSLPKYSNRTGPSKPADSEGVEISPAFRIVMASQSYDISTLKNEIAQLRQMVFHLSQSTTASHSPLSISNDPTNLKRRLAPAAPAIRHNPSQRTERVGSDGTVPQLASGSEAT